MSTSQAQAAQPGNPYVQTTELPRQDCISCRIIGTAAFGAVGVYALRQSRLPLGQKGAPKGPVGRRVMAGLGLCFLGLSYLRWNMNPATLLEHGHGQRQETNS